MRSGALAAALLAFLPVSALAQQQPQPEVGAEGFGPMVPATLDAEAQRAVAGANAFGLTLYKASIANPAENLFLSPASVSTAIGLAYRGARGATADELRRVMGYAAAPTDYLRINAAIHNSLNFTAPHRELSTVNSLWLQQKMPLDPLFEADVRRHAKAGINRVDYRGDADGARKQINAWVAGQTHERIRDLLAPPDVTADTRAVLVNAIYWKGAWAAAFNQQATRIEPFTKLDGGKIQTRLMHQQASYQVLERGGVKAINLPYGGGEVVMSILLPNAPRGLGGLETKLTAQALQGWLNQLDAAPYRDTVLTLPKMHIEQRFDLTGTLKGMGLAISLSETADFLGMVQIPYPGEVEGASGIRFEKVIHKTFLDVDEKGSEAAAATALVTAIAVSGTRAGRPPPPPFVFRADKPFLFLLRDRRTGMILFMGRYVVPQEAS